MIKEYQFGLIKINNQEFKEDVFINLDGKASSWWREQSHVFQKNDVENFLKKESEIVIFGTGKYGVAEITEELKNFLQNKGVKLIIGPTDQAIKEYNQAKKQSKKVVGFFHLTC